MRGQRGSGCHGAEESLVWGKRTRNIKSGNSSLFTFVFSSLALAEAPQSRVETEKNLKRRLDEIILAFV
jgi:hypothetical protein